MRDPNDGQKREGIMKRGMALILALLMLLGLTACGGKKEPAIDLSGKLAQLPGKQETPPQQDTPAVKPEIPGKPSDQPDSPELPDEPEPGPTLDSYFDPTDHPHEGFDLTVFDGIYRAKLPQGEDEETWLQITGYNDFIMLEYHGMMEGSIYRFWAEEFWPGEGWYTSTEQDTVSGKSQIFSSMGPSGSYTGLPQNRCITLTEDGVVLNYDDSDAEYFARDDGFAGGHTAPAELRERFGEEVHLDFDYQYDSRDVLGSWGIWTGWHAGCMTFREDGTFSMYWKTPNQPIQVYNGVFGFQRSSGNLEIMAEQIGYGGYPYYASWEWTFDEFGSLEVCDYDGNLMDGNYWCWPVTEAFFTTMDGDTALGYLTEHVSEQGDYADQYGTEYSYYYSLPNFYASDHRDLQRINRMINEQFEPIIEEELQAMENGEFLSYDFVDWQSAVYHGVLFLHVYAYAFDWEEHAVFYIDMETMEQMEPEAMLERLGLEEDDFLDTIRVRAEETFLDLFSELPEEDRALYGYDTCLAQTVSDEFVNLDLPIFVDRYGVITVYLKISSMAGSGVMWVPDCPFEPIYEEEAVG